MNPKSLSSCFFAVFASVLLPMPLRAQSFDFEHIDSNGHRFMLDKESLYAEFSGTYGSSEYIIIPSTITVNDSVFTVVSFMPDSYSENNDDVIQIELPSTIQIFAPGGASAFPNLKDLYVNALIPPFVDESGEERVLLKPEDSDPSCTLHVPAVSLELYRSDSCWQYFTHVTGISDIPAKMYIADEINLQIPEAFNVNELTLAANLRQNVYGHISLHGNGSIKTGSFRVYYDRAGDYDNYSPDYYTPPFNSSLVTEIPVSSETTETEFSFAQMRWNFISLPYDVKVADIVYPDSADFVIKEYDGQARASSDYSETWRELDSESTLHAGQGYIIQVRNYSLYSHKEEGETWTDEVDNGTPHIIFPASSQAESTLFSSGDVTVNLGEYPSEFKQNRGWNLVGNPYPCYFDMKYTDYSGVYYVWDFYTESYMVKSTLYDDYILRPGEAFFIQCPSGKTSITFHSEGRQHESISVRPSRTASRDYSYTYNAGLLPRSIAIRVHGEWNPSGPGDPGCNMWDASLGRVVIDYYQTGMLKQAIDNAIGLSQGSSYFDETVTEFRNRVKEIIVAGRFSIDDIRAYEDYPSCIAFDLSRTTGWGSLPIGSFSESHLQTILLPECMDSVNADAFVCYSDLNSLHLFSQIPPVTDSDAFDSIPKGATVYVPASAYPLYMTHPLWSQLNVAPFSDQVGRINVSLPQDWADGRYRGLKLQVTSNEYGHKNSYLITGKETYVFNNLIKGGSYRVELKRSDGITLSVIDDVIADSGNTAVGLPDVLSMYTDVIKVTSADGMDITGMCQIKWYTQDGTLAGEGYIINDITEGSELDYTIILPERYALEYALSDSVYHFTQGSENALFHHSLTAIPRIPVSGTVTNASTGLPVSGAQVIASYRVNGGYTKSFTALSSGDGTFNMEVLKSQGALTVVADGFFDKTIDLDAACTGFVSIALDNLSGQKVLLDITYTSTGDDENEPVTTQGYSDINDLSFRFYNYGKEKELNGYRLQYPDIWFVSDTIGEDDYVTVTISSKKGTFDTFEADLDLKNDGHDTLRIDIRERGRLKAGYLSSDDKFFNIFLFDKEGQKTSSGQFSSKEVLIRNLPEGSYTVVAASGKNGNISIARLEQLDELGLENDVDYVSSNVYIERGWTSGIEFEKLPLLDITNKNFLTYGTFESEKVKVYDGDFTTLNCSFSFRPDLDGSLDDVSAIIDLPQGCSFKSGSVLLNGIPADADLVKTGNAAKVVVPIQSGITDNVIRLSVIPSLTGTAEFSASVSFLNDNTRQSALIGSASVRVEGIAIHAQNMTTKDSISVSGTAPSGATVMLYDGEHLIGSTTASLAHQWFVRASLADAELMSRHPLSARILTENGWVGTDTVNCLYNPYGVYNAGILMWMWGDAQYDVCDVYESRQRGEREIPKTWRTGTAGWYNNTPEGKAAKSNQYLALLQNGLSYNSELDQRELNPWDDYFSWSGGAVYFDMERGEAEPSYTLGNFSSLVFEFQAIFPDCDSTNVEDVEFHILYEDSTVHVLKAWYKEKGHWQAGATYDLSGALPVNIQRIKYNPKRSVPFDSIPYMKMMGAAREEEASYNKTMDRLEELRQTALRLEAKENLTDAEKAQLQRCLEEGLSLMPEPESQLTDEQRAYLETLIDLDYEEQIRALKDLPGAGISQDIIDYILGENKTVPLKGTIEPMEIYSGYYSPLVTYNFSYSGSLTGLISSDTDWQTEFQDDNNTLLIYNSKGDFIKLEGLQAQGNAHSLIRSRGDGMPMPLTMPTSEDIDNALSTISDVATNTGIAASLAEVATNVLANNASSVSNALSFVQAGSVIGKIGGGLSWIGTAMEGKAAWDAMNRDNYMAWLEMGRENQGIMGADFLEHTAAVAEGLANWNAAVFVGHTALAAVSIATMIALGPVGGFIAGVVCAAASYKLNQMDAEFQAQNANLLAMWQSFIEGKKTNDSKPNRDPSGFVYEAVESNRLQDVTATVYRKYMAEDEYGTWHEIIEPWDAESYDQVNPQKTDQKGMYAWDVPEGEWRVVFNKEGYEPDTTEWLSVPPPQLDVNVGLTSLAVPYIKSVRAFEKGIDIYFSKYMRSSMLTTDNIAVTYKGRAVPGWIELSDAEWGPGVEEELASRVRFVPEDMEFTYSDSVSLIVAARTESYAGVPMESSFVQEFPVEREVEYLFVPDMVELRAGQTSLIAIEAGPEQAAAGRTVTVINTSDDMVSISSDTLTLDSLGMAFFHVTALNLGESVLTVNVPGFELSQTISVNVLPDSLFPAPPYSSVENGSTVQKGTEISLLSDSTDYYIWFTLDGSDPLNKDNPEVFLYSEPIVIDSAVTIKAITEVNGRYSYPATFQYQIIETGVRYLPKDKANELLYDLQGRPLMAEPVQSPYIRQNRIEVKK